MDVVDGPADEVIPEQHGHLEVGLLSRHVRRHRRSERPSPENHHLRSPPCAWYSRGRRCGCGGARRGSAPRGDGPCGRSRVTRRRRSEKDAMVMARGLARPWVCGAASSPPRATARVRVGGAVSILAHRRGGGAAHRTRTTSPRRRPTPASPRGLRGRPPQVRAMGPAAGRRRRRGRRRLLLQEERQVPVCAGGGKQVGVRPCVGKEARDGDGGEYE